MFSSQHILGWIEHDALFKPWCSILLHQFWVLYKIIDKIGRRKIDTCEKIYSDKNIPYASKIGATHVFLVHKDQNLVALQASLWTMQQEGVAAELCKRLGGMTFVSRYPAHSLDLLHKNPVKGRRQEGL